MLDTSAGAQFEGDLGEILTLGAEISPYIQGLGSITLKSNKLNYNYIALCSIKLHLQLQGILTK